ncbi:hypothetical protein M413DRAFT_23884 [Hebeloma cylindrosporum]|uniref:Uncharacterized protein n=1 Tax=Hebeloma cylindrosporum TaxID=76867 RepID=A0A0C2YYR8_HEBCY|nr:hypothetical protein M413DRAFT_23884 [Hebeloma cylindrosporum h7]
MRRLVSSVFKRDEEQSSKRSWKPWLGAKSPPPDDFPRQHLLLVSKNAIVPPLPLPPFVQHNLGPLFPRSVNPPPLLSPPPSLRVNMLRRHLVAHLDLDSTPPPLLFPSTPSFPDVSRPTNASKIFPASPGIRRWIARPCFEDRYSVYFPSPSGLDVRPVSAAALAVAALEFSEHLDAMAEPDFDHPGTPSHASSYSDPAPSSRNSYTPAPSPLRNQHSPAPPNPEPRMPAPKSQVKRVVRFAEDDSDGDDAVPLHIVRMKKMREQKAKFLRQEQLRRTREEAEERRRREQEARRLEDEALQREQRRQMLEKEKREREKILYAETIAATRLRRETHKAGGLVSSNTVNLLVPSSPSFTSLRDSERNKPPESRRLSRLPHDPPSSLSIPRRQASDSALPINSHAHSRYPSDSSPSSSRPPSMSHSPSPVSPGGHSRPPSTHSANTSSSEEIRHQGGSRRSSLTAAAVAAHTGNGSAFGRSPMIASYPAWAGSNPNLQYIPPVPPFPDFVHDMPLLPPTAPFMKHSYNPRSTSRNGSPGPPSSSSSRRGSFTSSTERVNQIPPSLSRNPSGQSLSPNPGHETALNSSVKPTTHQRRGSGDSRHTTHTHMSSTRSRPIPTTSRSQPTLSRGRPQQPIRSSTQQYLQAPPPSPWMPLAPQYPPMQPMPMVMMVPAMVPTMVPAYPMNMDTNANGMMQRQSNLRNGASGGGGGSTSSKAGAHGWRQKQAIIS